MVASELTKYYSDTFLLFLNPDLTDEFISDLEENYLKYAQDDTMRNIAVGFMFTTFNLFADDDRYGNIIATIREQTEILSQYDLIPNDSFGRPYIEFVNSYYDDFYDRIDIRYDFNENQYIPTTINTALAKASFSEDLYNFLNNFLTDKNSDNFKFLYTHENSQGDLYGDLAYREICYPIPLNIWCQDAVLNLDNDLVCINDGDKQYFFSFSYSVDFLDPSNPNYVYPKLVPSWHPLTYTASPFSDIIGPSIFNFNKRRIGLSPSTTLIDQNTLWKDVGSIKRFFDDQYTVVSTEYSNELFGRTINYNFNDLILNKVDGGFFRGQSTYITNYSDGYGSYEIEDKYLITLNIFIDYQLQSYKNLTDNHVVFEFCISFPGNDNPIGSSTPIYGLDDRPIFKNINNINAYSVSEPRGPQDGTYYNRLSGYYICKYRILLSDLINNFTNIQYEIGIRDRPPYGTMSII